MYQILKRISQNFKTKYCVGVNSGLDALILSLETLSLKKGSEIIVASNTYIATITAIIRLGLKPILVEPDLNSYNLDPNKIVKNLSKNQRYNCYPFIWETL